MSALALPLTDTLGRPLRELRISVTDRCNFRCPYCMPAEVFGPNYPYLPRHAQLHFDEIVRLARLFLGQGVRKIRLTGGEPLLRPQLETLIAQLALLRTPEGQAVELTLTTNGTLLARKAAALRKAGLQRLTVSLDALDDAIFTRMNGVGFAVSEVLAGLTAAQAAGFTGTKVNMVVQRGVNEQDVLAMAQHFRGTGITLRLIEYMDVGQSNGWHMAAVVPNSELIARLQAVLPLVPLAPHHPGETAQRWGWANAQGQHDPTQGEIGLISSVTQAFCHTCNRARLAADGQVFTCLFASQGYDLRALLRGGADDTTLNEAIAQLWQGRHDRYSALRTPSASVRGPAVYPLHRIEMGYIGG
ncbi:MULTISPECIES: GTP 3',8-cyclase MoaA [Giesbergeria]|uniref:GTP 3',8-cyclase n=1 Tax=Giesbergeria sinuosa TaxID=80883 RepID=A0ABV9QC42_9BURK